MADYEFPDALLFTPDDDWIRVDYVIGGTDTPTFTFAVAVGIEQ